MATGRNGDDHMSSDVDVEISSWVRISDASRIDYSVYRDGQVEFSAGGPDCFVPVTTDGSLRHFMVHAEESSPCGSEAAAGITADCHERLCRWRPGGLTAR